MIYVSPQNDSNDHSSDTTPRPKYCSVNSHIVAHLCQFMAQHSKIWGGQKIRQLFEKIGTFLTSKQPISDLVKNQNQGRPDISSVCILHFAPLSCVLRPVRCQYGSQCLVPSCTVRHPEVQMLGAIVS